MIRGRALLTIGSQVIEADGEALTPHTTNAIDMLAGQRYSVIVGINIFTAVRLSQNLKVTANQPVSNYWFNAPFVGGNPANNLHRKYPENSPFLHGSD
jgi:iron transport multicopper oxidase